MKQLLLKIFVVLLVLFIGSKALTEGSFDPAREVASISLSYCYSFTNRHLVNLDATYNVYYLTFLDYPISYLDIYGGISADTDYNASDLVFGYHVGARWTLLFAALRPEYSHGYLLYRDYSRCYAYGGVNIPVWREKKQQP